MAYRFMRISLFFDLPLVEEQEKRAYRKFIKEIKKEGFYMLQESVYVKLAIDNQVVSFTKTRINSIIPKEGNIMILTITEKQFSSIEVLLGNNNIDVVNGIERIITF